MEFAQNAEKKQNEFQNCHFPANLLFPVDCNVRPVSAERCETSQCGLGKGQVGTQLPVQIAL